MSVQYSPLHTEAAKHFSNAIRCKPDYYEAMEAKLKTSFLPRCQKIECHLRLTESSKEVDESWIEQLKADLYDEGVGCLYFYAKKIVNFL